MEDPLGFEPRAYGLKVRCSTAELRILNLFICGLYHRFECLSTKKVLTFSNF